MIARATILALVAIAACAALGAPVSRAAGACPARTPFPPLVSARPGSTKALVPHGATSVLICRYQGLNPPARAWHLEHGRLVTTAGEVSRLSAKLDAIPPTPPGAVYSCPMEDGTVILLVFQYSSGSTDPVTVTLTGCMFAGNGHVRVMAGPAIVSQLEALAG
jgi:hypothetical protein